jgi:hypothetical protein
MDIREKIKFDYDDAKENGQRLLKFALEDILPLTHNRLNQSELLDSIENLIEKIGKGIIQKARKRKSIEGDVFQMILLNKYVCAYKFDGKNRRIQLEYHGAHDIDNSWDSVMEVQPKIIYKNKFLFGFLK